MTFIRFWIGFTIIGLAGAVALLIWAFQKRQFSEPDRAAHLALSDISLDSQPTPRASRDTVALIGIFSLGLVMLIVTVVLSLVVTE